MERPEYWTRRGASSSSAPAMPKLDAQDRGGWNWMRAPLQPPCAQSAR
jgi:hypothetical protein